MWKTKHLKTHKRLFGFFVDMFMSLRCKAVSRNGKQRWRYLQWAPFVLTDNFRPRRWASFYFSHFFHLPYSWTNLVYQAEAETVVDLQSLKTQSINFSKLIFRFQFQLKLITDYSSSLCTALHSHWLSKGKQTLMQQQFEHSQSSLS